MNPGGSITYDDLHRVMREIEQAPYICGPGPIYVTERELDEHGGVIRGISRNPEFGKTCVDGTRNNFYGLDAVGNQIIIVETEEEPRWKCANCKKDAADCTCNRKTSGSRQPNPTFPRKR